MGGTSWESESVDRKKRNHTQTKKTKFFNYSEKYPKILSVNPCNNIPNAKAEKKLPFYFTLAECTKMLDTLDPSKENYERDYFIILFFMSTGVRLSEMVGIDIGDIRDNKVFVTG